MRFCLQSLLAILLTLVLLPGTITFLGEFGAQDELILALKGSGNVTIKTDTGFGFQQDKIRWIGVNSPTSWNEVRFPLSPQRKFGLHLDFSGDIQWDGQAKYRNYNEGGDSELAASSFVSHGWEKTAHAWQTRHGSIHVHPFAQLLAYPSSWMAKILLGTALLAGVLSAGLLLLSPSRTTLVSMCYGLLVVFAIADHRIYGLAINRSVVGAVRAILILLCFLHFLPKIRTVSAALKERLKPLPALSPFPGAGAIVLAVGIYLLAFVGMTFPLILDFSHFAFADGGDGSLMIWNTWWVPHAVMDLGQSPFHTKLLMYPWGLDLFSTTLHSWKGFLAIGLRGWLSVEETYNTLLIFSFVASALGGFLLAWEIHRNLLASLVAGFFFGFCNYHFSHALGHMNLVSMEGIAFFLLFFYRMILGKKVRDAIFAALSLAIVVHSDYYYFLYCVFAGILLFLFQVWRFGVVPAFKQYRLPLGSFVIAALVFCGPLVFSVWHSMRADTWYGSHNSLEYAMDLFTPFIAGGFWRFGQWTEFFWSRVTGTLHASSVYLGITAISCLVYAWTKRNRWQTSAVFWIWLLVALSFFVLALGPALKVFGTSYPYTLPYLFLTRVFTPLRAGGVPNRMMILTILAVGLAIAWVIRDLQARRKSLWVGAICLALVFELLPGELPRNQLDSVAPYVRFLKKYADPGAVLDRVASPPDLMKAQLYHKRPVAGAYLSREPNSVRQRNQQLNQLLADSNFEILYQEHQFRFLVLPRNAPQTPNFEPLYRDSTAEIYDLKQASFQKVVSTFWKLSTPR